MFLILESGLLVSGSVETVGDRFLELSFPACDQDRPALDAGGATLQFTSRRGVCQLDGEISEIDPDRETIRFDPTSEVVLVQRRDYVRVDAVIPVACVRAPRAPRRARTKTSNLSGGGFLLVEGCGLQLDHIAEFVLELGDGLGPVPVTGRVVRQTDTGGLGIQIEQISRRDRERIVHWVFDRERVDRRAAARRADFQLIRRAE